jgi:hypothetical protein
VRSLDNAGKIIPSVPWFVLSLNTLREF